MSPAVRHLTYRSVRAMASGSALALYQSFSFVANTLVSKPVSRCHIDRAIRYAWMDGERKGEA
jgi:hypothetical protein